MNEIFKKSIAYVALLFLFK